MQANTATNKILMVKNRSSLLTPPQTSCTHVSPTGGRKGIFQQCPQYHGHCSTITLPWAGSACVSPHVCPDSSTYENRTQQGYFRRKPDVCSNNSGHESVSQEGLHTRPRHRGTPTGPTGGRPLPSTGAVFGAQCTRRSATNAATRCPSMPWPGAEGLTARCCGAVPT